MEARKTGGLAVVLRLNSLRYGWLLASLLFVILMRPFVGPQWWVRLPLLGATLLVVATSFLSAWRSRRTPLLVVVGLLGLAMIGTRALGGAESGTLALSLLFDVLNLIILLVVIAADLMHSRRVSINTVLGACCVYVLLSLIWAAAYGGLEWFQPGSFSLAAGLSVEAKLKNLYYYSLITLTTVGYGDITPLTSKAQVLSGLQGVVGQLYLGIVIARLVGLEIADRLERRQ